MSKKKTMPLNSHWEYEAACSVAKKMKHKRLLTGLSKGDAAEYRVLKARIRKYRLSAFVGRIKALFK